jgi:hypothetical protein
VEVVDCRNEDMKHAIHQVEAIERSMRLLAKRNGSYTYINLITLWYGTERSIEETLNIMRYWIRLNDYKHNVVVIQNHGISLFCA